MTETAVSHDPQDAAERADAGPLALRRHALDAFQLDPASARAIPLFNVESVAAALIDRDGRVLAASPPFIALGAERNLNPETAARAKAGRGPVIETVEVASEDGVEDMAVLVYAPAASTGEWRLSPELRAAAAKRPDAVVVLTSQVISGQVGGRLKPFEDACRAHGLNGLQIRVVAEIVRTGAVRTAAQAAGVSFHTAREAVAQAMRRMRVTRLPVLVTRLTSLAFGVLPEGDAGAVLQDIWGLNARQAAVAGLIAGGATREAAANALAVSPAVVRKELEHVRLMLGVSTGAGLARKVVEAAALRWLTEATGGEVGFVEAGEEPLRFVLRPDGRHVAFSDYGPVAGAPLLVVHSTATSRIVARGLVRALQAAGYRPIAIDRPGFGLTDELAGARAGSHDPFAAATADAQLVLDALKIDRVDIVARGGAQFVVALARGAPERVGRVVLVNPDPPGRESGEVSRAVGVAKEAMMRSPALIRLIAPLLARQQTSLEAVADRMRRDSRSSPADTLALQDASLIRDYFRAQRSFATGRFAGWVNEQTELFHGPDTQTFAGAQAWRVLVGAEDFMHDPQRVVAYWRRILPDAQIRLTPGAGRYLAISQPHRVVEALRDG